MRFEPLEIPEVIKIIPRTHADDRGEFFETFREDMFNKVVGRSVKFVQDNQSLSVHTNTVRGLHYQSPPFAQGKLVRCMQGEIIDIAVDVRKDSQTYGHSVSVRLSVENKTQLWIPEGFLHGFSTLQPHTIVQYKCTNYYSPECDGNVFWNDPDLNLDWGIDNAASFVSDKDKKAPTFAEFMSPF